MKQTFIPLLVLFATIISCKNPKEELPAAKKYKIVYNVLVPDSIKKDDYELFAMDMDGKNKTNITNHPDVAWTYLAVNDTVLFISDRDTCKRCYFLYKMDANGKGIQKVTDYQLRDSWMGYRNNGAELVVNPHPKIDSAFYIIDRNGALLSKIHIALPNATDPTFSPDGNKIAFRGGTKKSKREQGYQEEIYTVNPNGTNLQKLTAYPAIDTTAAWYDYKAGPPRWHPSEDFITYQSFQNGKYSLFAVSSDGKKQWKLTPQDSLGEGWHDWSNDGKWLAIELFDTEQTQFHIGLMDWKTKELKILTDTTYKYQQAPVFVEAHH